jgi:hypothetical protein
VEAPRLKLAPSAKEALEQCIAQIKEFRPVAALTWTVGATVGWPGTEGHRTLEPHWGLGFYDALQLPHPSSVITEIDGIAFVFGFESDGLLDGGTLHHDERGFHVTHRAI